MIDGHTFRGITGLKVGTVLITVEKTVAYKHNSFITIT
jgi:hypothetical protein